MEKICKNCKFIHLKLDESAKNDYGNVALSKKIKLICNLTGIQIKDSGTCLNFKIKKM